MARKTYVPCKECGGQPCICEDNGLWAAHCMRCDNCIGHRGFYDPCASSEEEAIIRWNKMNTLRPGEEYGEKYEEEMEGYERRKGKDDRVRRPDRRRHGWS